MKKYKIPCYALLLSLLLAFTPVVAGAAEQVDVYVPVMPEGVAETSAVSEVEESPDEDLVVATEEESTAEDSTAYDDTDIASCLECLVDIRAICLGILFAASWGAGAVTASIANRGLHKC